jgi:tetratricopeptide (TPR) repeat protein
MIIFPVITFLRLEVWKNSVNLYSDILKKFPESFVALNSLGAELMFRNEDKKALEYLNKAVSVSPKNYKGYYNRGLLLLKNNEPEKAIKSFDQAIAIYDYPKAYVGRASAYYMLKDFPKALNDAKRVLSVDANNPKARFVMANCYNDLDKLDQAISEYNKCIEISSDDADFYFKRAIAYGKKQDFEQCMNDLNLCITLNETYFEAYYWRGVAKINLRINPCEDLKIAARNNITPAVNAYNKYCQ